MLLRELKDNRGFDVYAATVKVVSPNYSQWIHVTISARNIQEARRLLIAQYGQKTVVANLRKSK